MNTTNVPVSTMPTLFAGHGSPLNAIEDNEFSRGWRQVGERLLRPEAILCISAHWETRGTGVTAVPHPQTIYDFYGFPPELYRVEYPAPGSLEWAHTIRTALQPLDVRLDHEWGLDHGTWSVMRHLFPRADVPVLQLSLDHTQPPHFHYALGKALAPLRRQGLLIVGSGNIVHNLRRIQWGEAAFDWAVSFDRQVTDLIIKGRHDPLIHYETLGEPARLAIPTNEHYLPLLYILALQEEGEQVQFFNEKVTLGSISMRCVQVG